MVLALTRVGHARRQAALYHSRERRRSLLSKTELFRGLELQDGGTADLIPVFPDSAAPVTFEGEAIFNAAGPAGEALLDTGVISIQTLATGLRISAKAGTFVQDVAINPGRRFRWNLAIRPGDAQVRFWIDSQRKVAAQFGTAPFAWHAGGTLAYAGRARLAATQPLSIHYQQRPRHFGDANVVLPGGPATDTSILFRAAIATFLTGSFPFQDNPDSTP